MKLIHVWTDGSCYPNPGPGGWACIIDFKPGVDRASRHSGHLPDATNNIAEMTAVTEALTKIPKGSSVVIHCDSEYVINGATKWMPGWLRRGWRKADGAPVLNQDEWKALMRAIARHENVAWTWVRGHAGDPFNEECDKLAAEAREQPARFKAFPRKSEVFAPETPELRRYKIPVEPQDIREAHYLQKYGHESLVGLGHED